MSKNRVETLEATVTELESTVDGLTEELVEAKERIRVLEAELDAETPTRVPHRRTTPQTEAEPDDIEAATAEADSDTEADANEPEESGSDDIIVA